MHKAFKCGCSGSDLTFILHLCYLNEIPLNLYKDATTYFQEEKMHVLCLKYGQIMLWLRNSMTWTKKTFKLSESISIMMQDWHVPILLLLKIPHMESHWKIITIQCKSFEASGIIYYVELTIRVSIVILQYHTYYSSLIQRICMWTISILCYFFCMARRLFHILFPKMAKWLINLSAFYEL